jgi:hypothetical protein
MNSSDNAQARADKIGCMIKAKLDEGSFILGSGYQCLVDPVASPAQKAWMAARGLDKKEVCVGCAIGSLAFALGRQLVKTTYESSSGFETRNAISAEAGDLVSPEEVNQLEMGYEVRLKLLDSEVDIDSPFYKLGKAMAIKAGHSTPIEYEQLEECVMRERSMESK